MTSPNEKAVEREALERVLGNFRLLLAGKPVRDASETIAEAESALATQPPAPADRVALVERLRLMASSWRTVDTAGTIWATLTIDRDAVCSTLQRAADAIAASPAALPAPPWCRQLVNAALDVTAWDWSDNDRECVDDMRVLGEVADRADNELKRLAASPSGSTPPEESK
jgi:hypothetical protein